MNTDNQNENEQKPLPDITDSNTRDGRAAAELALRSGRALDARAEREAKERGQEDAGYIDPSKIAEHLDDEAAEREAGAPDSSSEIAPYTAVPREYEELAGAYHQEFVGLAREANLPAGEAENLMHFIIGRTVEDVHHDASAVLAPGMVKGPDLSNRDQCMSLLRRRYGNLTDELIRQSGQAFARLPEKVKRYLDSDRNGTGELLSNSPAVIAGLALWGAGFMRQTPEAAQKELDALSKSKTVDNYTKDRIAVLRHIVSRAAGSREHAGLKQALADKKAPKPVAKTAREKLEAELKQIRMDPGYYKRDAGNHKALVARVNAIYAELHPEGR